MLKTGPRPILYFYPRPPRGGRLTWEIVAAACISISIHALREEGDLSVSLCYTMTSRFLSTPSARRATPGTLPVTTPTPFLSTPSARRATLS